MNRVGSESYRLAAFLTLFCHKGNGDVFKLGECHAESSPQPLPTFSNLALLRNFYEAYVATVKLAPNIFFNRFELAMLSFLKEQAVLGNYRSNRPID